MVSKLKDFQPLYKKVEAVSIPLKVPEMGLDVELRFTPPTQEVKDLMDGYLLAIGKKVTKTKAQEQGVSMVVDLIIYMKQTATRQLAQKHKDNSEVSKLIADLEVILNAKYETYEKLSYWMTNAAEAISYLHKAIALCFPEITEPENLHDQIKFILAVSILSASGKVMSL